MSRAKKEPLRMGAVLPTSARAAKLIAKKTYEAIKDCEGLVVEVGPGTGCITRELLDQGIPADKLICVELDPALHQYMTEQFPELRQIILGDAANLRSILGERCGKVGAVVSAIPMNLMSKEQRKRISQAYYDILKPAGKVVQLTYRMRRSIKAPGLERSLGGFILFNFPPAFVWTFTKVIPEEKSTITQAGT